MYSVSMLHMYIISCMGKSERYDLVGRYLPTTYWNGCKPTWPPSPGNAGSPYVRLGLYSLFWSFTVQTSYAYISLWVDVFVCSNLPMSIPHIRLHGCRLIQASTVPRWTLDGVIWIGSLLVSTYMHVQGWRVRRAS